MKKAAAAILTGLVVTGLSAAPVFAAPEVTVKQGVGIGTAWTEGAGVRITVPGAAEIQLIDTATMVTLDPEGGGTPDREAHARFNAARVTAGSYADVPVPNWSSDLTWRSGKTEDAIGVHNETVKIPKETEQLWTKDWEDFRRQTREAVDVAEDTTGTPIPFDENSLFSGTSQVWMEAGALVDGLASPGALSTHLDGDDATAEATSMVDILEALSGLGVVVEGGLGGHGASMSDAEASAQTTELMMKEFRMELKAVLGLFGIKIAALPDATLVAVYGALGLVDTDDFADRAADFANRANAFVARQIQHFGDAEAYLATLMDLKTALMTWAGLGLVCDQVDEEMSKAGIDKSALEQLDLECVGLTNAVQGLLNDVRGLINDLHEFLVGSLEEASLLTVLDLKTSLSASASVNPEGTPVASVTPVAGASQVLVGGINLLGQEALQVLGDDSLSLDKQLETLNGWEDRAMGMIDLALGAINPDLAGRVDIRFVPKWQETTEVVREGSGYAHAHGESSFMKIWIRATNIDLSQTNVPDVPNVPGLPGGGGGALPLARADIEEPIEIALGEMSADAEHTRPGVRVVCCDDDDDDDPNTPPNQLPNSPWDPNLGFGTAENVALDGGETSRGLPRTGAASGSWPIVIVAGLGAAALGMRRFSMRAAAVLPSNSPPIKSCGEETR